MRDQAFTAEVNGHPCGVVALKDAEDREAELLAAFDQSDRLLSLERLEFAVREKELLTALDKLWKHTAKIDNGRCMVCGVGYASFLHDGKGALTPGPCDDSRCLSHVVTAALRKAK